MERAEQVRVCIAGATGWTGRAIVRGVLGAPDLVLTSAVSRSAAGGDLGAGLGGEPLDVPVHAGVDEALDGGERDEARCPQRAGSTPCC